jgi:imidazolonepropionase-like amidohydrolase
MANKGILAAGFIDLTQDGVNYHDDEYLLVDDGRIAGFDKKANLADDLEVIDYSDYYCLPGLIDTAFLPGLIVNEDGFRPDCFGESVWQAKRASESWLATGVTSAASMGAFDRMDFDLAASIATGLLPGPRIYPALSPIAPLGASKFHKLYGVREVTGAEEARRAARELIKMGADRIVLYADVPLEFHTDPNETSRHRLSLSLDEVTEIVLQAKQAGCFVHAQAISLQAIETCIEAGVRSIGCAFGLQEKHIPAVSSKGIALAPNLALGVTISEKGPNAGFSENIINMVASQRISPELLAHAHQSGVEIICGTNTAFLAGNVYRECWELHKAGLSPEDVLRVATQNGAKTLKPYVQCGSFGVHHFADLIFVQDNPVQNLQSLSAIHQVMIAGNRREVTPT